MKHIKIWTDGSCLRNPDGPGGWAAILEYNNHRKEISGGSPSTTNNRMELQAIIEAFKALTEPCRVTIHTDSKYAMKGVTEWMQTWEKNGWKRKDGRRWVDVANVDLWMQIDEEIAAHSVHWEWVRGHNGDTNNERADTLAKQAANEAAFNSI